MTSLWSKPSKTNKQMIKASVLRKTTTPRVCWEVHTVLATKRLRVSWSKLRRYSDSRTNSSSRRKMKKKSLLRGESRLMMIVECCKWDRRGRKVGAILRVRWLMRDRKRRGIRRWGRKTRRNKRRKRLMRHRRLHRKIVNISIKRLRNRRRKRASLPDKKEYA